MDRSVDPCTDFYHYTCGGWIKKNPIPSDQARWDVYAKLTGVPEGQARREMEQRFAAPPSAIAAQ